MTPSAPLPNYDLAILVVLYNCQPDASQTLNSLAAIRDLFQGRMVRVCIWNNGPAGIPELNVFAQKLMRLLGVSVASAETLENTPLSMIYNFFLSSIASNRYLILDHDSTLSPGFIDNLLSQKDIDFLVPHILVNGKVHGPILNGAIIENDRQLQLSLGDSFISIGSGLTIYQSGLVKLKRHYPNVFDEHFALYGVDSSFWLRVMAAARNEHFAIACRSSLTHSFSRLENETPETVRFRRKERGYDVGIILRRYPSAQRFFTFAKVVAKRPFVRRPMLSTFPSILCALRGFVAGKHPRCNSTPIRPTWHSQ